MHTLQHGMMWNSCQLLAGSPLAFPVQQVMTMCDMNSSKAVNILTVLSEIQLNV